MATKDRLPMKRPADTTRVAIYTRVSSQMQVEEGFSLEAQLRACRKFAEERGWNIVAEYEEPGVSGKDSNRPTFRRMIREAQGGHFDVILTHKLDRFSRSILDVLTYLRDLNEFFVYYSWSTENFDFSTPMGKMQLHIMAALAQWYLDNLSQEITKGKKARAEAGFWNGNLPFGYRSQDARTIEVDKKEAEGVRLAFRLCATGAYTYVEIAKALNEGGYRTHGRGKFSKNRFTKFTARDLLHNRFYLGYAKYRQTKTQHRQFDYFKGKHPAIIDQALWDKAHRAIQSTLRRRARQDPEHRVYPLTGLAVCEKCGSPFRGQSNRGYTYYKDSGHAYGKDCKPDMIPAGELESPLIAFFAAIAIDDDIKQRALSMVTPARSTEADQRERADLLARQERNKRLFQLGDLTDSEYMKERGEIDRALARLQPIVQSQFEIEEAAKLLNTFGRMIAQASPEDRKAFFRTVLEEVVVENREIVEICPKPNFYDLLLCVRSAPEWI